jgi:hypothetical protein
MKKTLAAFFLLLLSAATAHAAFQSGNDLKNDLDESDRLMRSDLNAKVYSAGVGDGYVLGVADALQGTSWCGVSGVTVGQLRSVVKNYVRNHPEELHLGAPAAVAGALRAAFPCKK